MKFYFTDCGLRNVRINFRQYEETHIMENIIYNELLIKGYNVDVGMAENTLGRKIRDGAKEVKILGDLYQVKAQVEQINAFSAHADYEEMTDWLKTIDTSRLKNIFMVHGEKDAQEFFTNYLNVHGFPNVSVIKYDETYELG